MFARDTLNPFFLYEIRQIVRNRFVQYALCLYLLLLLCVCGATISMGFQLGSDEGAVGRVLASRILSCSFFVTVLVLTVHGVLSTCTQGIYDETVFIVHDAMKQMRRGKNRAAAVLCLMFHSASLPFLSLAWLLGGVDLSFAPSLFLAAFVLSILYSDYVCACFVRVPSLGSAAATFVGLMIGTIPWFIGFGAIVVAMNERLSFGDLGISRRISDLCAESLLMLFFTSLALAVLSFCSFFVTSEMYKNNFKEVGGRAFGAAAYPFALGVLLFLLSAFFAMVMERINAFL